MDRLETGLRLLVETFKRAFGELAGDIDQLRADVAKVATPEDVERAVARTATRADVEHLTVAALRPLRTSLEELFDRAAATPAGLHEAVDRLVGGIDAAQAVVHEATTSESRSPNGPSGDAASPDPVTIWGEENGADPGLQSVALGPRDHRRRSGARRRLEKSWPGRAYAQWKWRRT
jgi:hypothetical protein